MRRVHVPVTPEYDVLIGEGVLGSLPDTPGRLAVVVDANVAALHEARIEAALADRAHELFILPSGEVNKTLQTASTVFDWLADRRIERREVMVAIGGGVTGDLTGFVAATWRRGLDFVQVPTTLLSQVDASVGGKVAVDHPSGKNLIGAFHQPIAVLADTAFFSTLPVRERWSGLAEVVKTALLAGDPLLSLVEAELDTLAAVGGDALEEVVALCVAYKAGVVQRDPRERGERAVLNFGHTVGHALETVGGYERLLHGEAIALGLDAALELSGFATDSRERKLVARLVAPSAGGFDLDQVMDAMKGDKKVEGGRPKFALLDKPGVPRWGCDVDPDRVREVVRRLVKG